MRLTAQSKQGGYNIGHLTGANSNHSAAIKGKLKSVAQNLQNAKESKNTEAIKKAIKEFNEMKIDDQNWTQTAKSVEADCLQSIFNTLSDETVWGAMVDNIEDTAALHQSFEKLDSCVRKEQGGGAWGGAFIIRAVVTMADSIINTVPFGLALCNSASKADETVNQGQLGLGLDAAETISNLKAELRGGDVKYKGVKYKSIDDSNGTLKKRFYNRQSDLITANKEKLNEARLKEAKEWKESGLLKQADKNLAEKKTREHESPNLISSPKTPSPTSFHPTKDKTSGLYQATPTKSNSIKQDSDQPKATQKQKSNRSQLVKSFVRNANWAIGRGVHVEKYTDNLISAMDRARAKVELGQRYSVQDSDTGKLQTYEKTSGDTQFDRLVTNKSISQMLNDLADSVNE